MFSGAEALQKRAKTGSWLDLGRVDALGDLHLSLLQVTSTPQTGHHSTR